MKSERIEHIKTMSKKNVTPFGISCFLVGNSAGIAAKRLQYCNDYEAIIPWTVFVLSSSISVQKYNQLRETKEA